MLGGQPTGDLDCTQVLLELRLFRRLNRAIELTDAGQLLLPAISRGFSQFNDAVTLTGAINLDSDITTENSDITLDGAVTLDNAGGGVALIRSEKAVQRLKLEGDEKLGAEIIANVLDYPLRAIAKNALGRAD